MSTANVVVQGVTAQVNLRGLDRSISELGTARERFSLLHDLGHHIWAEPGVNESGMSAVLDGLVILTKAEHDHVAGLPTAIYGALLQPGATFPVMLFERPTAYGLPTWNTRVFVGLAATPWFGSDPQNAEQRLADRKAATSPRTPGRVVFHVPAQSGVLLVDSWAGMVRVIDSVLAALLLMRLVVHAGIRSCIGIGNFILIIIAACRRYGRRTEPHDHAPLFIRRQLMSMGSFTLAC